MNILRPQKILFNNLKKIENLNEEIDIYKEIENISIENYKKDNVDFSDVKIEKAILNNKELTFQIV